MIPELRDDRFAAGRWRALATGAPALDWARCASFDCRVASSFDFGTHRIVIGEVVEVVEQIRRSAVCSPIAISAVSLPPEGVPTS